MYIAIDGDEIGKQLELLLFSDSIEQASSYSNLISSELDRIREHLLSQGCEVIFCGGDSILAHAKNGFKVQQKVLNKNGITWSVGIGEKPSSAALALKKAKGLGRNRVEIYESEHE